MLCACCVKFSKAAQRCSTVGNARGEGSMARVMRGNVYAKVVAPVQAGLCGTRNFASVGFKVLSVPS